MRVSLSCYLHRVTRVSVTLHSQSQASESSKSEGASARPEPNRSCSLEVIVTDKVSGAMAFINTSAMQTGLHGYDDWFGRDRESEPLEQHDEDELRWEFGHLRETRHENIVFFATVQHPSDARSSGQPATLTIQALAVHAEGSGSGTGGYSEWYTEAWTFSQQAICPIPNFSYSISMA